MAGKTNTEVIIDGKVYTLSGYESQEYLQRVASYINDKVVEFKQLDEYKRIPSDMRSTLLALNLADDYFKAKAQAEKLEAELEQKEKELYDLKHELIGKQMQNEADGKTIKELEKENKELLLNKTRLEATLEEALLGKVEQNREAVKNAGNNAANNLLKNGSPAVLNNGKRR
ncbi:MAG: cell division protein ZapA [Lachnospiraceae bacterium]|nr:cell division protein ZapA [Lachnospiraceae bacterium]